MATPNKQYQNVSFKELITYSENNPNRNRQLNSIEVVSIKSSNETTLDNMGLKGYNAFNLNPSGIMSLYACIEDPVGYSFSTKGARIQQIINYTTKLQEQTDSLKNSSLSRKRKKIHDLIAASYNGSSFDDKDYMDLYSGISLMRDIHFVLMKSVVQDTIEEGGTDKQEILYDSSYKGEIIFSSDPTTWKKDNPIWIVDYRAHWVAIPSDQHAKDLHSILASWISTIEQNGWVIQWPQIDGTKVEIVEKLSVTSSWQVTDKKHSKEVLASRLGRINTIQLFTQWQNEST